MFLYQFIWLGALLTCIYSIRFIKYVFLRSIRSETLYWKSELDKLIFLSVITLIFPRIIIGKFINFIIIEYLYPPFLNTISKIILRIIILISLFRICISPLNYWTIKTESFKYIWNLRKWSSSNPRQIIILSGNSSSRLFRFGLKDYIFLNWILLISSKLFFLYSLLNSYFFKTIISIVLIIFILICI